MNKKVYIVLFTIAIIVNAKISFCQRQQLYSVKIELEDFNTESFRDVNCEEFASIFKETKKTKLINDQTELSELELFTKDFKPAKYRSLDVRGSITYNYEKSVIKYCFDRFGYFYKDGRLFYNKNLLIALSDKIYNNHPKYLDTLQHP